MIVAGDRGYARVARRRAHDSRHQRSANPKLLSHINWSPPFPGGTHTALPLPGRKLVVVADEVERREVREGDCSTPSIVDVRAPENPVPIATLPTPTGRDFCAIGQLRPAQPAREPARLASSARRRSSRPTTTPACACSISATQFAPKEIASWVPPVPAAMIDPRPNVARTRRRAIVYVTTDG